MGNDCEVLVVGGGLAGMAAALELHHQGRRVLLLERAAYLGGKAHSAATPEGVFPDGPVSFNGRVLAFWRFLELLGLTEAATPVHAASSARYVVRNRRLKALEPHPWSVLRTGALSLRDKWSLAREYLKPPPRRLDEEDESLEALLVRRFGQETVDHFLAAVMTGIFAGDLRTLSAQACMPALVAAEREYGSVLQGTLRAMKRPEAGARPGLYTLAAGFAVLGERAAERLPCVLSMEVDSITLAPSGVVVRGRQGHMVVEYRARHAIVATEAPVAAKLLQPVLPAAAQTLAGFPYAPLALVQWRETEPSGSKLPLGFGYLAAPVERLFALGTLFVGDLLSQSPRRFSTFVGGALHPERAALPEAELLAGIRQDLATLTGGTVGDVVRVVRWPRAVFQPPIGHGRHLQQLQTQLAGSPLFLAGSYFGGAAMKDALSSGFLAADALLQVKRGAFT